MRYNKTRHKLFGVLAEKFRLNHDYTEKDADVVGLNMYETEHVLGKYKNHRDLIISELGNAKEIHSFSLEEKGFFITPEGLSAYADGKYNKKNNDIIKNGFKDFNQIAIPIIALTIALLTLILKLKPKDVDTEVQVIENNTNALERIEIQLESVILKDSIGKSNRSIEKSKPK